MDVFNILWDWKSVTEGLNDKLSIQQMNFFKCLYLVCVIILEESREEREEKRVRTKGIEISKGVIQIRLEDLDRVFFFSIFFRVWDIFVIQQVLIYMEF